jgi:hypothetical protein
MRPFRTVHFQADSFSYFYYGQLRNLDSMYTSMISIHLISECGRSPLFEEYIGNMLAVFVSQSLPSDLYSTSVL